MRIALKILVFILTFTLASSFYIHLTTSSSQCFYNYIFKDEQLLVEIQTPIISADHKIVITVKNGNEIVLQKDIINLVKLAVPRTSNQINDNSNNTQFQYQTCLKVEKYINSENEAESEGQVNRKQPNGYFISVKIMTNFSHLLQSNVEKIQKSDVDYRQIEKISQRLFQLNSEQINLHQINEIKQKLTQTYLQTLKQKVIVYSIIEIIMILLFTVMQVKLLQGYISDLSII